MDNKARDIEPYYLTLGEKVRSLRLKRNWSQEHLGSLLGLSSGWVTAVENAKSRTPTHRIVELAKVFRVDPAVLTSETDGKEIKKPTHVKALPTARKEAVALKPLFNKPIDEQVVEAAMMLHDCLEKGNKLDTDQALILFREVCEKKKNHLNYLEAGDILMESYKDK